MVGKLAKYIQEYISALLKKCILFSGILVRFGRVNSIRCAIK